MGLVASAPDELVIRKNLGGELSRISIRVVPVLYMLVEPYVT